MSTAEAFGDFDFGLDADAEERARRLHRDSIVIDLLFQGPCGRRSFTEAMVDSIRNDPACRDTGKAWGATRTLPERLATEGLLPEYETCWRESGITVGTTDLEVGSAVAMHRSAADLVRLVDGLPWLSKVLTAADVQRVKASGGHGVLVNCQPQLPISRDLGLLDAAFDFGLRMLMLTYNDQDLVGSGCTDRTDGGLSRFGVRVVERLNELGVIVDTAHCGKQTTLDACEASGAPVVASHTSAESLHPHARAKSDEEIEAIAGTGGVVAVYAVPPFLGGEPTVARMLDHIDHVVRLVGVEHVAIGTDWPLQLSSWMLERASSYAATVGFRPEDGISADNLVGFDDYRDMPNITRGLVARGYGDDDIRAVLGGNALRVLGKACG